MFVSEQFKLVLGAIHIRVGAMQACLGAIPIGIAPRRVKVAAIQVKIAAMQVQIMVKSPVKAPMDVRTGRITLTEKRVCKISGLGLPCPPLNADPPRTLTHSSPTQEAPHV